MGNKNASIAITVLAVVVIVLGVVCYGTSGKLNQAKIEISALNAQIEEKDAAIQNITGQLSARQKELDAAKTELDSVKKNLEVVQTAIDNTTKQIGSVEPNPIKQ